MEIAQLDKLEELRRQGATGALVQAILQELRNQIFNYKQAGQAIVDAEGKDLKIAAGAMRVLEIRLHDSGINTDLFPELSDKEYVASTYKFIEENSNRMRSLLSPEDVSQLDNMVRVARNLPDCNYYVENYTDYINYNEAKYTYESLGFLDNWLISQGIGCGTLIGTYFLVVYFISQFPRDPVTGIVIGVVIGFVGAFWIGGLIRKAKNSKKRMAKLDQKLDFNRMSRIDKELAGDTQKATKLRDDAQTEIRQYFGDSPLLPITT